MKTLDTWAWQHHITNNQHECIARKDCTSEGHPKQYNIILSSHDSGNRVQPHTGTTSLANTGKRTNKHARTSIADKNKKQDNHNLYKSHEEVIQPHITYMYCYTSMVDMCASSLLHASAEVLSNTTFQKTKSKHLVKHVLRVFICPNHAFLYRE